MTETAYMEFTREDVPGRKTPIVTVTSRSSGAILGQIRWYGPWRQFCFYPWAGTIFNVGCMDDIKAQIAELRAERAR